MGDEMLTANQVLTRVYDEEQKALTVATPENVAVEALASARDTTGGRASADMVNKFGRGLAVLVNITEVRGTGVLSKVAIEAKILGSYVYIFEKTLDAAALGASMFAIYPGSTGAASSTGYGEVADVPMVRDYRVRTETLTDGAGDDVTYSVSVVHLL